MEGREVSLPEQVEYSATRVWREGEETMRLKGRMVVRLPCGAGAAEEVGLGSVSGWYGDGGEVKGKGKDHA